MSELDDDGMIKGNNNIHAGRDVVILDDLSLSRKIRDRLQEVDKKINEILPHLILSPTRNNSLEQFSSSRMLQSLSKLGIPIEAAIDVLDNLDRTLLDLIGDEDQISTRTLRKAVTRSIYSLDVRKYGSTTLQHWGDQYARRYGDPESQITVIEVDGSTQPLVYQYLIKEILPHLIEKLLKISFHEINDKYINNRQMRFMAENILDHVRSMNLYKIQYKTLFNLAEDLATQPPHPWFVRTPFINDIVIYDLERAKNHRQNMPIHWNRKDIASCWHSTIECIYHSCSSILAFYGAILGGAELATLHHLINVLTICESKDFSIIWEQCNIAQLEGDLRSIDVSIHSLLLILNKAGKFAKSPSERSLRHLIEYADRINDIAIDLMNIHVELNALSDEERIKCLTDDEVMKLIVVIFKKLFKHNRAVDLISETGYWMIHNIDSALFRNVKAEILVVPLLYASDAENVEKVAKCCIEIMRHHKFSNTAVFVFPEKSKYQEHHRCIEAAFRGDINNCVSVPLIELVGLCAANDRIQKLEILFVNHGG